jgi:DNA-binding transcriptional ArsR family regulator
MDVQRALEVLVEPRRRAILERLRTDPCSVGELAAAAGLSQPGASKHLRMLRESGFVAVDKRGTQRVYRLAPEPLMALDAWLADYRAGWASTLDALGRHLDDEGNQEEQ